MEGGAAFPGRAVYPDALGDLQDKPAAGLRAEAAGAYILCG